MERYNSKGDLVAYGDRYKDHPVCERDFIRYGFTKIEDGLFIRGGEQKILLEVWPGWKYCSIAVKTHAYVPRTIYDEDMFYEKPTIGWTGMVSLESTLAFEEGLEQFGVSAIKPFG